MATTDDGRAVQGGPALPVLIVNESLPGSTPTGTQDVRVTSALPAGTNNIGDVDLASALPAGTNNIGDVDVLSVAGVTQLPTALGQQTRANSLSVTQASDATGANAPQMQGTAADGAAVVGNPVLVGGFDGTNTQTILTSPAGRQQVAFGLATADGATTQSTVNDANDSGRLLATGHNQWNGAAFERVRIANIFKTATAAASGDNAIWTPAASKKFRLLGYQIEITGDASLAVAGVLTLTFRDATTAMPIVHSVYLPAAAPAAPLPFYLINNPPGMGNGILSAVVINVLNLNLSAALTSGTIRVNVFGTEE